jgi:hypothetical protein
MHEGAQIISDVGLVYEAVRHGVDSLVQCVIDLGRGVSLPCGAISLVQRLQFSRRACGQTAAPSVVHPAHPWVVCGQRFHHLAGNAPSLLLSILWQT